MYLNLIAICLLVLASARLSLGEESTHLGAGVKFLMAPLYGWDRNELTMEGPPGQTSVLTDTAPEYGLFTMIMHPRFVLNNTVFFLEPNDTEVTGDMLFLNLYGSKEDRLT